MTTRIKAIILRFEDDALKVTDIEELSILFGLIGNLIETCPDEDTIRVNIPFKVAQYHKLMRQIDTKIRVPQSVVSRRTKDLADFLLCNLALFEKDSMAVTCAKNGQSKQLKYLFTQNHPPAFTILHEAAGKSLEVFKVACSYMPEHACYFAAESGHLDRLQYAREVGCTWDYQVCQVAAYSGYLDCLRYAHGHGCYWNEDTCMSAAVGGQLDCLRWAHENGCPWDYRTCYFAAGKGHLNCLRYAHENGCPWNYITPSDAAAGGHLDCLQYAIENECPWNRGECLANSKKFPEIQAWIRSQPY